MEPFRKKKKRKGSSMESWSTFIFKSAYADFVNVQILFI